MAMRQAAALGGAGDSGGELQAIAQGAERLRTARVEGERACRAEAWGDALAAFEFARSLAPQSEALRGKAAQLRPLAKMQAELDALRAERATATGQVAAAALTPPRRRGRAGGGQRLVNAAEVLRLLDKGELAINAPDEAGRTPLLWAAAHGLDELLRLRPGPPGAFKRPWRSP